ncbi:MAG: hypothetical protein LBJ57_00935 [Prevotellaceae bacterium]|jgi:hypothetical protein|nr:hypothetical protein [Prevotellaceae bacterium]
MYRQIFKPTEHDHTTLVRIPREWYGQTVEIIAFPITTPPTMPSVTDEDFYKLCGAWESSQSAEEMAAELPKIL